MNKTDNELLKLAAKAAGIELRWHPDGTAYSDSRCKKGYWGVWNPLTDDGDALRLAVDLGLDIVNLESSKQVAIWTNRDLLEDVYQKIYNDKHAATRRAIVIAAAAIGEAME